MPGSLWVRVVVEVDKVGEILSLNSGFVRIGLRTSESGWFNKDVS